MSNLYQIGYVVHTVPQVLGFLLDVFNQEKLRSSKLQGTGTDPNVHFAIPDNIVGERLSEMKTGQKGKYGRGIRFYCLKEGIYRHPSYRRGTPTHICGEISLYSLLGFVVFPHHEIYEKLKRSCGEHLDRWMEQILIVNPPVTSDRGYISVTNRMVSELLTET